MLSTLVTMAVLGAFIAGTIVVVRVVLFGIEYVTNMAREKFRKNNQNKVMIAETADLFKNKMDKVSGVSISDLEKMNNEVPFVTAVYDADRDEVVDIQGIKPEKMERKLKSIIDDNDGFLIVED